MAFLPILELLLTLDEPAFLSPCLPFSLQLLVPFLQTRILIIPFLQPRILIIPFLGLHLIYGNLLNLCRFHFLCILFSFFSFLLLVAGTAFSSSAGVFCFLCFFCCFVFSWACSWYTHEPSRSMPDRLMPEPHEDAEGADDFARILLGGVSFAAPFHNFGLGDKNDELRRACSYVQLVSRGSGGFCESPSRQNSASSYESFAFFMRALISFSMMYPAWAM